MTTGPMAWDREFARLRVVMVALITLGVVVLVALVVLSIRIMTPQGIDVRSTRSGGLRWIRSIYGYGPSASEQLGSMTDVAIADDGTIWATDPANGRVLGFSSTGSLRRIVGSAPATGHPRVLVRPEGVGAGPNGSLYVADYGRDVVLEFDRIGRPVHEWRVPSPMDVAEHQGRLAVSTLYGVAIIERDGGVKTIGKRGRGISDFDVAHGVAFGPDGSLYVADTQNGRVKAYDPNGMLRWVAEGAASRTPTASAVGSESAGVFELASGMAVDGASHVVFCDPFSSSVVMLDAANGRVVARYGEMGVQDGKLLYPSGIAYDNRRDLFAVADTRNRRVQVFKLLKAQTAGEAGVGPPSPLLLGTFALVAVLSVAMLLLRRRVLSRRA